MKSVFFILALTFSVTSFAQSTENNISIKNKAFAICQNMILKSDSSFSKHVCSDERSDSDNANQIAQTLLNSFMKQSASDTDEYKQLHTDLYEAIDLKHKSLQKLNDCLNDARTSCMHELANELMEQK